MHVHSHYKVCWIFLTGHFFAWAPLIHIFHLCSSMCLATKETFLDSFFFILHIQHLLVGELHFSKKNLDINDWSYLTIVHRNTSNMSREKHIVVLECFRGKEECIMWYDFITFHWRLSEGFLAWICSYGNCYDNRLCFILICKYCHPLSCNFLDIFEVLYYPDAGVKIYWKILGVWVQMIILVYTWCILVYWELIVL